MSTTLINPALTPKQLQQELLEVLTPPPNGVDGYDMSWLVNEYLEWQGEPTVDDELSWLEQSEENKTRFEKWLKATNQLDQWMRDDPGSVPAMYWFMDPEALPAKTWLIHHAKEGFDYFDRGAGLENLAFTWSARKPKMVGDLNLDDQMSAYDRVYGFAFQVDRDECVTHRPPKGLYVCSGRRPKYGSKMVIFQCDAAVETYHPGDEEHQVIFPIGSEYNVRQIGGDDDGSWWLYGVGSEDDMNFETIYDVQTYMEQQKVQRRRRKKAASR